jgi:hypothetical protein
MRDVLRAVEGLAHGLVFDVGERVTLGRSAVSDVQLAHPDVSRFHAIIERDPEGRSFITDLASKSGVVVDGHRVQRAQLRRGTLVQICHFQLRYDTVDDRVCVSRPAKITGAIVVSATREVPRAKSPTKATAVVEGPPAPIASESLTISQVEIGAPGEMLELVRDVMEYRVLALDGVIDSFGPRGERMRVLRARFDVTTGAGTERPRRQHHRFARTGPVLLGVVSGTETHVRPAQMIGLGAGGAGVVIDDPPPADAQCWLLVATGGSERSAIGFPARVAWSNRVRGGLGLAFIGRPIEGADLLPPVPGK